jgi:P pilus assembly chaperone PapD
MVMAKSFCLAQVGVSPQYLFYDLERKSMPISVSNPGDATVEVTCSALTGYVTSDDTGRTLVSYDSTDTSIPSAARWVQFYPSHFIVEPKSFQTVRLVATPAPGSADGEYWARLAFTSKPAKARSEIKQAAGLTLIHRVVIPFHYRLGRVSTGLTATNLRTTSDQREVVVTLDVARTGNAAYWGSATARILDKGGSILASATRKVAVYKNYTVRLRISRDKIPAGDYTLDVRLETGNRGDIADARLIKAPPVLMRNDINLR